MRTVPLGPSAGIPAAASIQACEVMTEGSLCAMGGLTPLPVRSALRHFPDDFLGPNEGTKR